MEEDIGDGILFAALEDALHAVFRVEFLVLGAHARARRVEHDVDRLHEVFEGSRNGDARGVEVGALVGSRRVEFVGHAALAQRPHRQGRRHVGHADQFHIVLERYARGQPQTDDAVPRHSNSYFRHIFLLCISDRIPGCKGDTKIILGFFTQKTILSILPNPVILSKLSP